MHRVQKDFDPRNVGRWLGIFTLIVIGLLDAGAKSYALLHFPEEQDAQLHPVLSLAVHKNPGVAFDLPIPHLIVVPLTLIVIALFLQQLRKCWDKNIPRALASTAVIIGALGNLVDRLIHGFTTDYLIFFTLSAINLSDVLIVLGIIGVLCYDRGNPRHGASVTTNVP